MKRDSTISHTGLISKDNTMVLNLVGCLMVFLSHFGSYCEIRTFAPLGSGGGIYIPRFIRIWSVFVMEHCWFRRILEKTISKGTLAILDY